MKSLIFLNKVDTTAIDFHAPLAEFLVL
jgi:hypothetical protein